MRDETILDYRRRLGEEIPYESTLTLHGITHFQGY